ncbi:MAG: tetratricopeptide repeat protein [Elusimicrobia bacterium]|nr:tetratricopeptide repeat protein [Elusimicrobiota bacterium]
MRSWEWETLSGRVLFLAGLAAWLGLSFTQLPYGYHDVHYLTSLEWGCWGPSEWVHALFVPLLALYRAVLGMFGFHGKMFLAVELLNGAAGGLTLVLMFAAVERWRGRSLPAAAGALLLGFSTRFWEATLRPDPYALAGLCSAAALIALASVEENHLGSGAATRFALAGLAAGLAAGFHASALSLVPVAVVAAWRGRTGLRPPAWFLGTMALVLCLCYGVFVAYHGVTPAYFSSMGAAELFSKVEQIPGTSLFTSRDPLKQAGDYWHSLWLAGGSTLLPVAGLLLLLMVAVPAAGPPRQSKSLPAWVAAANLASYSIFFFINNSQNGFVYGGLLGMPLLLASWARGTRAPVFVAAALVAAGLGSRTELAAGPSRDPMLSETRFLDGLLKPGDAVVVPGCPFPEMIYERRFNFLAVGGSGGVMGTDCGIPLSSVDALPERVAWMLGRGRRVYFTEGDLGADFNALAGDVSGAQKLRQVFWTAAPEAKNRLAGIRTVRRRLESSFKMECGISSPQGWRYCGLSLKPGQQPRPARGIKSPAAASGLAFNAQDVELLSRVLLRGEVSVVVRLRTMFLMGWLFEAPDDPYARQDIVSLAADEVDLRLGFDMKEADRIAALIDALALKRPSDADKLLDRAEFYSESGRKEDAAAALRKARSMGLSPAGLRRAAWAWQSLGDCAGALTIWRELAAGRPSAKDLSDKAVCEFTTGDWQAAVADLEKALELSPSSLEAYASLAAVRAKRGELSRALEVYERGLAIKGGKGEKALRPRLLEGRDLVRDKLANP